MAIKVTDGSYHMSIGERVELSVAVTQSSAALTDFRWELPLKHILEDYVGPEFNFHQGKKVPFDESNLTSSAVSFNWAEDGEYKIRVNYKMDGADKTDDVKFKVHRPTVFDFFATTNGTAKTVIVDKGWCGMFGPMNMDDESRGIVWTARVNRGAASPGRIAYIQLVNFHHVHLPGTPSTSFGAYVLDGAAGKSCVFYWNWRGTAALAEKTVTLSCRDSPGARSEKATSIHLDDKFKLYLMYKSEKPGSIWTPLGKLLWHLDAKFSRPAVTEKWAVDGSPSMTESAAGKFPVSEFPEWNNYAPYLL